MKRFITAACVSILILTGCASSDKPEQPVYTGIGGMTKWNITPSDYLFHYNNGFTGIDALGYNEHLQTVWSRLGGAQTCGIDFDAQSMIYKLIVKYGETTITHELNGIGFHSVQSRKVPKFCDISRIREINKALTRYNKGYFI